MNAPLRPTDAGHALDLSIERGADGRSRIAHRSVRFPWSVGRGYPGPPGDPVVLIPQCAGAGLLSGDRITQRIGVGSGAALDLQSAGAMLTYGHLGGPPSVSDWRFDLGSGSRTRVFSEPCVLLDNADLDLRQTIVADASANLVVAEGIAYAGDVSTIRWQTQTTVCRPDGRIVFRDRQCANSDLLRRLLGMPGRWSAFGTMIVLTPEPQRSLQTASQAARDLEGAASVAVAKLAGNIGICARIAAADGQNLRDAMRHLTASGSPV